MCRRTNECGTPSEPWILVPYCCSATTSTSTILKLPRCSDFITTRRQSQPEWAKLAKRVPIYAIWDDHDFTTNDGWGGPDIDKPAWKRDVWKIFKENWNNPYYGGGEKNPGCWFDFRIGDVHFIMLDGRYYRESPKSDDPSMLGPVQMKWLKNTLADNAATFKILCCNVPMAPNVKPGSKDTWDGYSGERRRIQQWIAGQKIPGVIILSADRHRSDAYQNRYKNRRDVSPCTNSVRRD